MEFIVIGHKNILGMHSKTIEFTKDAGLTKKGDCILGVSADFDIDQIKAEMEGKKKVNVRIKVGDLEDSFTADVNPSFSDSKEIVFRKSEFVSDRTLGVNVSKACIDINREIVEKLKNPEIKMEVMLEIGRAHV